jgi:hypothetical protein
MKKVIIILILLLSTVVFGNDELRLQLIINIEKDIGIMEEPPNSNRGPRIDLFNEHAGVKLGSPYCTSFITYHLDSLGIKNPGGAWSPSYARSKDIIWKYRGKDNKEPLMGDVVSYYYGNLGRVGHVGFFEKKVKNSDTHCVTIEANTSGGSGINRNGGGIYRIKRDMRKIYAISRYL